MSKVALKRLLRDFNPSAGASSNELSLTSNAICYFSGYIINYTKKRLDCNSCLAVLTATNQYDDSFLISQRCYGENSNLITPSEPFFSLVRTCVNIISENIESIIFTIPVRKNLANLLTDVDFSFLSSCHRLTLQKIVIFRIVNTLLMKYL